MRKTLTLTAFVAAYAFSGQAWSDETVRIQGAHYVLEGDIPKDEAQAHVDVLDAAWGSFREYFGTVPPLTSDERLRVRFFSSRVAWENSIRSDGGTPPKDAGGYYWPTSRTAYLYRQPTAYYTRALLLHETAHQFHFLSRTGNRSLSAPWYVEGVAEHLAWHRWDGLRVTLGVVPDVSLDDYPAAALKELRRPAFPWQETLEGRKDCSRPVGWAIVHYLASRTDADTVRRWTSFRDAMDRGMPVGTAIRRCFGRAFPRRETVVAWLTESQSPWSQVFNQWEGIDDGKIRGSAPVVSVCRLKEPCGRLSMNLQLPSTGRAGLLLHYEGPEDYTLALLSSTGALHVDRRRNGKWERLATESLSSVALSQSLSAERDGSEVRLVVGGGSFGPWKLPGDTFGLALDACTVVFDTLNWR